MGLEFPPHPIQISLKTRNGNLAKTKKQKKTKSELKLATKQLDLPHTYRLRNDMFADLNTRQNGSY